ncbi:ribonuclease HI [Flavisphingopyxis soli]|uniref:ribonuclease HI n=1 Tax=Flavisphingopyxis soli TaxID=2601267 RepID=UPI001375C5EC|nr:reverse transcriptase-like protein [Sphingorhabdus soli]
MIRKRVKVFFDGGCRPNPGPIEAAVVMRGVAHLFDDLGSGTSNDAEWLALILGFELAQASELRDVELIGDALDVIIRAQSVLKTGHAMSRHEETLKLILAKARPARIRWIRREQNLAGISLATRHPR